MTDPLRFLSEPIIVSSGTVTSNPASATTASKPTGSSGQMPDSQGINSLFNDDGASQALNRVKNSLGDFKPKTCVEIFQHFSYDNQIANQDINTLLANTDRSLELISKALSTNTAFQHYTNPESEDYQTVVSKLKNKIQSNNLNLDYSSELEKFQTSQKVALLISNTHDDHSRNIEISKFYQDIFSDPDIKPSSGFNEGGHRTQAKPNLRNQSLEELAAKGIAPELISMSLLDPQPALSFQEENSQILDGIKSLLRYLVLFSTGTCPYSEGIERNRNHSRLVLLKHLNEEQGFEYITSFALSLRKILDKETEFSPEDKKRIYEYITNSFLLFAASQENNSLKPALLSMDFRINSHYQDQSQNRKLQSIINNLIHMIDDSSKQDRSKRNEAIADQYQKAGNGLRIMRIGHNHLDTRICEQGKDLKTLLEARGFAVIVVS